MTQIIVEIPAPVLPAVKRRATGRIVQPSPWLNVNDHNMHPKARAKIVKLWREAGRLAWEAHPARRQLEHAHVVVYVHRASNTRSDAGNFYPTAKAVMDGMVDAGMLPDDNDNYLTGPDMRRGKPGELALTVVVTTGETPELIF